MTAEYSVELCNELKRQFNDAELYRPMCVGRYDAGEELAYDINPVENGGDCNFCRASLVIERFVGGGFAGQVYKVKLTGIEGTGCKGLEKGGSYAMKILIPPSGFSIFFRQDIE